MRKFFRPRFRFFDSISNESRCGSGIAEWCGYDNGRGETDVGNASALRSSRTFGRVFRSALIRYVRAVFIEDGVLLMPGGLC